MSASSAENYYEAALNYFNRGMKGDALGQLVLAYNEAKKITHDDTRVSIIKKLDALKSKC